MVVGEAGTGGKEQVKAGREKYWSELTDREKIERMRRIVKATEILNAVLNVRVSKLMTHEHAPDGRIVVPLDLGYPQTQTKQPAEGKELF